MATWLPVRPKPKSHQRHPPEMTSTSDIVPYDTDTPRCAGCNIAVSTQGDGCEECIDTMNQGLLPKKGTWAEFSQGLTDPRKQRIFQEWQARRKGKRTDFEKQGVEFVTRVGMTLRQTFTALDATELVSKYGPGADRTPGLQYTTVDCKEKDGATGTKAVVLIEDRHVLETFTTTEAVSHVESLAASQQLRPKQGDEVWNLLLQRTMASRPGGTALKREALDKLMAAGQRSSMLGSCGLAEQTIRTSTTAPSEAEWADLEDDSVLTTSEQSAQQPPSSAATPPFCTPPSESKKRGRTRSAVAGAGKAAKRSDSAIPLTIMNVLSGAVKNPKAP